MSFQDVHGDLGSELRLPSRPAWHFEMSREELEHQEAAYFQDWLARTYTLCPKDELSYFEHNLEVWRQLWRVCEISSLIVVVVDIRHPVLHFPPSLYEYVVRELKREMVVVLTKTDLVPPQTTDAWVAYILSLFPGLGIVKTSIYDLEAPLEGRPKRYANASGVEAFCQVVRSKTDARYAAEWDAFLTRRTSTADARSAAEGDAFPARRTSLQQHGDGPAEPLEERVYCTVGVIGHPNAGKSSLINAIVGRKVVSASKTPGHTKHFQTIHLDKHIRLCDCPGLIFPMRVPKWLQILAGIYNVAQVSDPYEPLLRLAQHCDLAAMLRLVPGPKSILQVCEEYAEQRGFITAKAAHADIYRAANYILRGVVDGRLLLSWKPPGYFETVQEDEPAGPRVLGDPGESDGSPEDGLGDSAPDGISQAESVPGRISQTGGAFALLGDSD